MTPLGSLLDATAFLTRLPVPARRDFDLARAAWAFPLVGALVGAVVGGVAVGASALGLPLLVAAVLAVLAEVLVTGALHLDGLADCADGCGGHDRESRLRIMKDHAVGVYGVSAVALDLLLKVALLHGLLSSWEAMEQGVQAVQGVQGRWAMVGICAAVWALSRAAMLPLARWLPYARAEGTGRSLVAGLGPVGVGVGAALAVAVALLPLLGGLPLVLPAVLVVGAALAALAVAAWARRMLGGVTGDVLGAAAEMVVVVGLMAAVIVGR